MHLEARPPMKECDHRRRQRKCVQQQHQPSLAPPTTTSTLAWLHYRMTSACVRHCPAAAGEPSHEACNAALISYSINAPPSPCSSLLWFPLLLGKIQSFLFFFQHSFIFHFYFLKICLWVLLWFYFLNLFVALLESCLAMGLNALNCRNEDCRQHQRRMQDGGIRGGRSRREQWQAKMSVGRGGAIMVVVKRRQREMWQNRTLHSWMRFELHPWRFEWGLRWMGLQGEQWWFK